MSSSSGMSSHTFQALNVMPEDSFEMCAAQMTCTLDETHQESHTEPQNLECKETNVMNADFVESVGLVRISANVLGDLAEHNPVVMDDECCENGNDVANTVISKGETRESPAHIRSTSDLGASPITDDCPFNDHSRLQENDVNETPHGLSTTTASEIEPESSEPEIPGLGVHDEIPESERNLNAVDDCSEKSMVHASVDHHSSSAPVNEILGIYSLSHLILASHCAFYCCLKKIYFLTTLRSLDIISCSLQMSPLYLWSVPVEKSRGASHLKKPLIQYFSAAPLFMI